MQDDKTEQGKAEVALAPATLFPSFSTEPQDFAFFYTQRRRQQNLMGLGCVNCSTLYDR